MILLGGVGDLARLPDKAAVTADDVRTAVAVRLAVDEEHGLADLGRQGVLAGERARTAVEDQMAGQELAHALFGVGIGIAEALVCLEGALLVARDVEVLLAALIGLVVGARLAALAPVPLARH